VLLRWLWVLAVSAPWLLAAPARPAVPADGSGDGLARAQRWIAEREYWASPGPEGLQAPNRTQNLRSVFGPRGLRVRDRTAPGSPELVTLSWVGVGRPGKLRAPGPGTVSSEQARVEVRRAAGLVEWYRNSPEGLEQGFELAKAAPGRGRLVLELALEKATARALGDTLQLRSETGRFLSYSQVSARDASGRELAAVLEVPDPTRIRIVVDDAGARYPVAIDPILTATADAQILGTGFDGLGYGVASAGDVNGDGYADVIIGAPLYSNGQTFEGAAFVFLGGPSGIASGSEASADAIVESNQGFTSFGSSVASAGDVNGDGYADVIVGAPSYSNSQSGEGAAFVFLGGPSGVASADPSTAAAVLESDQADAALGKGVASAGDVNGDGYGDVIVGAPDYSHGDADEGAAFVFLGSPSGVASADPSTAAAVLESNQGSGVSGAPPHFGSSVATAGDVNGDGYADVIVGAPLYTAGQYAEGAAFVFLGSATGVASGDPSTASATLESNQV